MINALIWNQGVLLLSAILLASSVAIWLYLPANRIRVAFLTILLLLEVSNISLISTIVPPQFQLSVLSVSFVALSLQWVLIALATVPLSNSSADVKEPTA